MDACEMTTVAWVRFLSGLQSGCCSDVLRGQAWKFANVGAVVHEPALLLLFHWYPLPA